MNDTFSAFWAAYPRRIGKLAAEKAYAKALRHATADEILAGVQRYCQHLPDDPQFICHPTTFLNQGRWADEYEDAPRPTALGPSYDRMRAWTDECAELHGNDCGSHLIHHNRKMREQAA